MNRAPQRFGIRLDVRTMGEYLARWGFYSGGFAPASRRVRVPTALCQPAPARFGIEVRVAYDGQTALKTALEQATRRRPVGHRPGWRRRLSGGEKHTSTPSTVAGSAYRSCRVRPAEGQKDIEASRSAGIDQHIVKTIDFSVLVRLIS